MKHRKKYLRPKGAADQNLGNGNELKTLLQGQTGSSRKEMRAKVRPRLKCNKKIKELQDLSAC